MFTAPDRRRRAWSALGLAGLAGVLLVGPVGEAAARTTASSLATTTTVKLPPKPSLCSGRYSSTIVVTSGSKVGTSGNDLIYVIGDGVIAYGGAGDDCLVVVGKGNLASGDKGNDRVVDANVANRSYLTGGADNDILSGAPGSVLDGNLGTDTCTGGATKVSCER